MAVASRFALTDFCRSASNKIIQSADLSVQKALLLVGKNLLTQLISAKKSVYVLSAIVFSTALMQLQIFIFQCFCKCSLYVLFLHACSGLDAVLEWML